MWRTHPSPDEERTVNQATPRKQVLRHVDPGSDLVTLTGLTQRMSLTRLTRSKKETVQNALVGSIEHTVGVLERAHQQASTH